MYNYSFSEMDIWINEGVCWNIMVIGNSKLSQEYELLNEYSILFFIENNEKYYLYYF